MIRDIQTDEKNAVLARLDELPSWVFFPDKERVEWINQILKHSWPYLCSYMHTVFTSTIEPIIQASVPPALVTVCFKKIDLGDIVRFILNILNFHVSKRFLK